MASIPDMLRRARALLIRRGATPHDAEDLVHEAFLKVEAYSRAADVRSQEAMLVRTALNLAIDDARRRRRAPFDTDATTLERIVDPLPGPDEVLTARERLTRLRAGLEQLSPKAQRILLAQRVEGLSYKEIAEREGLSIWAVEKQIARAVDTLTRWMDAW